MEYQFVFHGALYIFYNQNILFSAFSHLHIPSIQLEKLEHILLSFKTFLFSLSLQKKWNNTTTYRKTNFYPFKKCKFHKQNAKLSASNKIISFTNGICILVVQRLTGKTINSFSPFLISRSDIFIIYKSITRNS